MASLVFVKDMADIQMQSIRTVLDEVGHDLLTAEETRLFRQCNGRAAILHLSGAMSFGAANEMMRRIVGVRPVETLIIDLTDVPSIDGSAALTLEEIMQRGAEAGQDVFIVGMQLHVARVLSKMGILDEVRETTRFATRLEAIQAAIKDA
jgi:SulP family sulfate permease